MTKEQLEQVNDLRNEIEQLEREIENIKKSEKQDVVTGSMTEHPYIQHSIVINGHNDASNCEIKPKELRPCPFCGDEASVRKFSSGTRQNSSTIMDSWIVNCEGCGAETDIYDDNIVRDDEISVINDGRKEAMEAWNRRATDD